MCLQFGTGQGGGGSHEVEKNNMSNYYYQNIFQYHFNVTNANGKSMSETFLGYVTHLRTKRVYMYDAIVSNELETCL
jgi:hypothetical protein